MGTQWLSGHFSLDEMVASQTATRFGIDNTAPLEILKHLEVVAQNLEAVRTLLGEPLIISSGYRCAALNEKVGGVPTSAHVQGYAADFICPAFGTPYQICGKIMASGIKFDQCIQEGANAAKGFSGWVHISFAPAMRQEALSATFDNTGKASYTAGVKA